MLRAITSADAAPRIFAWAIAIAYGLLPAGVLLLGVESPHLLLLSKLAGLASVGVLLGGRAGLVDRFVRLPRMKVRADTFLAVVWTVFIGFVLLAMLTAERIPFVAALQGADPETLVVLRERFLKAREGWESSFVYINAVLAGALIPYSLMMMLIRRYRLRWVWFGLFLLYCLSFVEKAFFVKAALPLLYVVAQQRAGTKIRPAWIVVGAVGVLLVVAILVGAADRSDGGEEGEFFSTTYSAQGPIVFLAWRAVAIPVLTAADALRVFEEEYQGQYLLGASSSLLAGLLGRERVSVERDVFAAQFGQTETDTGSANSVYLTEAYLNFGYVGVLLFSLAVGALLRTLARSRDEALRSLWMLLCFGLFVGPLTGTLFSNGFVFVIALSALLRFDPEVDASQAQASPAPQA